MTHTTPTAGRSCAGIILAVAAFSATAGCGAGESPPARPTATHPAPIERQVVGARPEPPRVGDRVDRSMPTPPPLPSAGGED